MTTIGSSSGVSNSSVISEEKSGKDSVPIEGNPGNNPLFLKSNKPHIVLRHAYRASIRATVTNVVIIPKFQHLDDK